MTTPCEITDCNNPACSVIRYVHPDPAMRWEAPLCVEHWREAQAKAAAGECVYAGPATKGGAK